jgi:DNA repair protein RadD
VTLRPYQADLDARRRASRARRVCVQLPTGGGKSHLIREAARGRALLLGHAEWLIDQLHALVGGRVVKAGMPAPTGWPIVGMVQTVARRELPEAPEVIIPDESHHCVAGQWREVIGRYPEARVYGFTATPRRLDGLGLENAFDELICGPSYGELIADGWLKPFQVLSVPSGVDLTGARTRAGDYAREDVKLAVRRSTVFGDVVEHYLRHCRELGGHASFWPSIESAEHAAERFRARGIRCLPLHSGLPRVEVRARVAGLRTGVVDSLATVDMIGEGLDVPGLSSASLCRPTQSLTVYLQQAGRCNRGGRGVARVLDHVANWQRHGLPDDDREWTLEGRVKRKAAPGVLPVWDCEACWTVNRSTCAACVRCGAPKPRVLVEAEERAAELEVISRADKGDIHELCATPAEYARFARAKGQRPEWGALKWAERLKRHAGDNPFLAAAGTVRPTLREFLSAAEACGLHSQQARAYGRGIGLRW